MKDPVLETSQILGVVLAGGQSRRMGGGDKALLDLGGRPLIAHVIERARPQVGALIINANGDPLRFASFGLPILADTIPGFPGPLAGLLTGLRYAAAHGFTAIAAFPADTPFPPPDQVARLARALAAGGSVAAASADGRLHPLASLIPVALAEDLEEFIRGSGSLRVSDWVGRHRPVVVEFARPPGSPLDPFFNVNTPADLVAANAALQPLPEVPSS
jgi:molybdopterin-guanine dinucleotide biosynthesis protein A